MRILVVPVILLCSAVTAAAQTSRFQVGAVTRSDSVALEGSAHGRIVTTGVAASVFVTRSISVEAELTSSSKHVKRSYEGRFFSFAQGPNASPEEIERLMVTARRSVAHVPGVGGALGVAAHSNRSGRVEAAFRAGLAWRRYVQTSTMTFLHVPDGFTAEQAAHTLPDSRNTRMRGGLLLGLDVPIHLTPNLVVVPEARWVWGGPARVGNNYRELSAGARLAWQF